MSMISTKKICVKCVKGTGIVTCDGCQRSFCQKHLFEHREELSQQIDQINNQCEEFRQTLKQENDPSTILSAIDLWEKEAIEKIHFSAQSARTDVRQLTERIIHEFNQHINQINIQMESSKDTNDTTEVDLNKWTQQLQTLKDIIKKPFPITLINDDKATFAFHFIKVKYESPFQNYDQNKNKFKQIITIQHSSSPPPQLNLVIQEKFHRIAGRVKLSDNNLTATCLGYSSIAGIKLYETGIHRIMFDIIQKKNEGIFFGIITSKKTITPRASELTSVYGFRDFDKIIINGNAQLKTQKDKYIQTDDQITFTIDCDHSKISLYHHQINKKVQTNVDLNYCPLPWKLIISSYGEDTIAIVE